VLLVKLSALGDIVHAFPAVTEALARVPGLEIDWLVDAAHAELVRQCPGVGRVLIPADIPSLQGGQYARVVDAQGLLRSAVLARRVGGCVVGADWPRVREWPSHWVYHRRVRYPAGLHAVDAARALLGSVCGYVAVPGAMSGTSRAQRAHGVDRRHALLFHGTAQAAKLWPLGHWAQVARHLLRRGLEPVVTAQGTAETAFAEQLAMDVPGLRFLPGLEIQALRTQIDASRLVVSVDTGLGHFADWLGCPVLMLFQASDPRRTGPYFSGSRAIWAGTMPTRPRRRDRNRPPLHPLPDVAMVIAAIDEMLT
jgi:heptosyltransferase-1